MYFELNLCELNDDIPADKFNKAHNNPKYKIGILISWKKGWANHAIESVATPIKDENIINHFNFKFLIKEKYNTFLIDWNDSANFLLILGSINESEIGILKNKMIVCK